MTVEVLDTAGPVNARTLAMLIEASRISGINFVITQGQNPGGVAASAGTHDGTGVVDLRVTGWTTVVCTRVLTALRSVGFAAWIRLPTQGNWPKHCHAVAMGDPGLSPAARRQVTAYRNGLNGLANNGPDDGPKGYTGVLWESYLKAHQQEDDMAAADVKVINDYTEQVSIQVQKHIDQMKDDYAVEAVAVLMQPANLDKLATAIAAKLKA